MPNNKNLYAATPTAEEQEAAEKRRKDEMEKISPVAMRMPGSNVNYGNYTPVTPADLAPPVKKERYGYLFGESPEAKLAGASRDSAFQNWLNTRKQTAEKARTDNVAMARYNAMGNLLTTLVQPIGWAAGGGAAGATGIYEPYDDRAYLEAFNRAVKASDDLRNIGTAEGEYQFKVADEQYRQALEREEEERKNQFNLTKLEEQYRQKVDLAQQKFDQDIAKEQEKAKLRMELAEFNAAHRIVGRGSGGGTFTADERRKNELLKAYLEYAQKEREYKREPSDYQTWLKGLGYYTADATNKPPADGRGHADL